ncbi:Trafficking protein particle complex subunit 11 [Sparganum proliferum]
MPASMSPTHQRLTANLSERGSENSAESVAGQELQATTADQSGFVVLGQYQAQLQRKSAVLTMTGVSLLFEVQVSATLAPESELVCPLFLRCASPGDRSLRVNASYSLRIPVQPPQATLFTCSFHKKTDGTNGCFVESSPLPQKPKVAQSITAKCAQSKRVQLTVLPPFDLSWRILSLQSNKTPSSLPRATPSTSPAPEPKTGGYKCDEDSKTCLACTGEDDRCADLSTCEETCRREAPEPTTEGFKCDEEYKICVPCSDEDVGCADFSTCEETFGEEGNFHSFASSSSPSWYSSSSSSYLLTNTTCRIGHAFSLHSA